MTVFSAGISCRYCEVAFLVDILRCSFVLISDGSILRWYFVLGFVLPCILGWYLESGVLFGHVLW